MKFFNDFGRNLVTHSLPGAHIRPSSVYTLRGQEGLQRVRLRLWPHRLWKDLHHAGRCRWIRPWCGRGARKLRERHARCHSDQRTSNNHVITCNSNASTVWLSWWPRLLPRFLIELFQEHEDAWRAQIGSRSWLLLRPRPDTWRCSCEFFEVGMLSRSSKAAPQMHLARDAYKAQHLCKRICASSI